MTPPTPPTPPGPPDGPAPSLPAVTAAGFAGLDPLDLPWDLRRGESDAGGRARAVKASRSRKVLRLETGGGVLYAKRYLINTLRRRAGNVLTGGKARREFELGRRLADLGVATPEPLLHAIHLRERRNRAGEIRPAASYLITRGVPSLGSLRERIEEGEPAAARELLTHFAVELARLHRLGFQHDDCSAEHFLVTEGGTGGVGGRDDGQEVKGRAAGFCVIDLDNSRLGPRPVATKGRLLNLFQILRSLDRNRVGRDIRTAFIEAYRAAAGGMPPLEECEKAISEIAARKSSGAAMGAE